MIIVLQDTSLELIYAYKYIKNRNILSISNIFVV